MTDSKLQIELVAQETQTQNPEIITRTYTYKTKTGKDKTVIRKYTVKNDKTFKSINNKEAMNNYVEEHKDKYINLPRYYQSRTVIADIKKDLGLELSYNGAITLLKTHCGRVVNQRGPKPESKA